MIAEPTALVVAGFAVIGLLILCVTIVAVIVVLTIPAEHVPATLRSVAATFTATVRRR